MQSLFTGMDRFVLVSNIILGVVVAWGIAAALTVSVECSPHQVIRIPEESGDCRNQVRCPD
jgi:hypothetical protein